MDALYGQHCPDCGGRRPVNAASDEPTPEMIREAARIAKGIFDGTIISGEIDPALTELVAEDLRNAIIEGFGKDLPAIDYDTPDFAKLANLEKNVYHFSGAKNYQELKSMTLALKDGDRIRTFTEFRDEALKINAEYNGTWLRTEYNTAIGSAQMAAKWSRFESDKKTLPLLQYRTVEDERVRPTHAALDLVIRNIDDPFWDMYYPPNGWNCRCDVIQVVHGTETPYKDIVMPDDVPKMFQTNMAKQGIVFPPKHPYYIGVPDAILKEAEYLLGQRILNWGRKFLSGEKVAAQQIGEVTFTDEGLAKIIEQPHEFLLQKNQAMYALKQIAQKAEFVKTEGDLSYFKFTINGKPAYLVVKGKEVYSIIEKLP